MFYCWIENEPREAKVEIQIIKYDKVVKLNENIQREGSKTFYSDSGEEMH